MSTGYCKSLSVSTDSSDDKDNLPRKVDHTMSLGEIGYPPGRDITL